MIKPPPTAFDIDYNNALAAVRDPLNPYPTQVDCGFGETWSVALSNSNLVLNWYSDSRLQTVWDSLNGLCAPNTLAYGSLSSTVWFSALSTSNFPITSSHTRLAYTPTWADPQTGNVTRYNLNLYCGFLRIETDLSNSFGAWNNFQGILGPTPLLNWPHTESAGTIVWQLWDPNVDGMAVQFRGDGGLRVASPSDPFNARGTGNAIWNASTYFNTPC